MSNTPLQKSIEHSCRAFLLRTPQSCAERAE
jgi:hypothetical protein